MIALGLPVHNRFLVGMEVADYTRALFGGSELTLQRQIRDCHDKFVGVPLSRMTHIHIVDRCEHNHWGKKYVMLVVELIDIKEDTARWFNGKLQVYTPTHVYQISPEDLIDLHNTDTNQSAGDGTPQQEKS